MTEKTNTNQEKSISSELDTVLGQLSTDQIRFVVARQQYTTDKEAAHAIGIKPDTVYHWPDVVKEAVRLMATDGLTTALHVRRRHLGEAMLVKVDGLKSGDERIRQTTATEIIEWELGKAQQQMDVTSGGEKIGGDDIPDDRRMAAAMAVYERIRARLSDGAVDDDATVDSAE